jgi:hypothetical protein
VRQALSAALVLAAMGTTALGSPSTDLEEARRSFRAKDCASAMKTLSFLLYPEEQLAKRDDLVEAHAMLGACKADVNQVGDAKAQFREVLKLQPDKTLGELLFSSTAIRVFEETRRDKEAEEAKQAAMREIEERAARIEAYRQSQHVYERQLYVLNFVPFGVGQFQERRNVAGLLFASGGLATGGASAGIWLYLVGKYGISSKNVALADGPGVRRLQEIEIGSGIAFILVYAGGIFDAVTHYEPKREIQADDSLLPPDLRPPAPKRKTSLRDRLHFGPIVTPSGLGIGLALEND